MRIVRKDRNAQERAGRIKPFCDGTQSKIGFAAAEAAVPESAE